MPPKKSKFAIRRVLSLPDASYPRSDPRRAPIVALPSGIVDDSLQWLSTDDLSKVARVCRFWWTLIEFSPRWRDLLTTVDPSLPQFILNRLRPSFPAGDDDVDDDAFQPLVPWRHEAQSILHRTGRSPRPRGERDGFVPEARPAVRVLTNYMPYSHAPWVVRTEVELAPDERPGFFSRMFSAVKSRLAPPTATVFGDGAGSFMQMLPSVDTTLVALTGVAQADLDGVRLTGIVDRDQTKQMARYMSASASVIYVTFASLSRASGGASSSDEDGGLPKAFMEGVMRTSEHAPMVVVCSNPSEVVEWANALTRLNSEMDFNTHWFVTHQDALIAPYCEVLPHIGTNTSSRLAAWIKAALSGEASV